MVLDGVPATTDLKVAVWVAVQRRAAWCREDRSTTLVQHERILGAPSCPELLMRLGSTSKILPTVANAVAKPSDNGRQVQTAVEHQPSAQAQSTVLDDLPTPTDLMVDNSAREARLPAARDMS